MGHDSASRRVGVPEVPYPVRACTPERRGPGDVGEPGRREVELKPGTRQGRYGKLSYGPLFDP